MGQCGCGSERWVGLQEAWHLAVCSPPQCGSVGDIVKHNSVLKAGTDWGRAVYGSKSGEQVEAKG